jgi:hypothetical protein
MSDVGYDVGACVRCCVPVQGWQHVVAGAGTSASDDPANNSLRQDPSCMPEADCSL